MLPGVVVASAIGGYFITRAALKPIDEITKMSDEISEGRDLSRRLNMRNVTMEAYILAQSYDKMLERLERSFDMEKQFTSDASHELRTPTAVIISQCEYAQEHDATYTYAVVPDEQIYLPILLVKAYLDVFAAELAGVCYEATCASERMKTRRVSYFAGFAARERT